VVMNYKFTGDSKTHLDQSLIIAVDSIWADANTKACVTDRASEFYLMDSAP
jgi:hypothetical protein